MQLSVPILPAKLDPEKQLFVPQGNWLQSGANLTIQIVLKYPLFVQKLNPEKETLETVSTLSEDNELIPLVKKVLSASAVSKPSGPFGRLFILVAAEDEEFVQAITRQISAINSRSIFGSKEKLASLSQYRLSPDERRNLDLNIFTGYQIYDDHYRIFLIEGIKKMGVGVLATFIKKYEDLVNPCSFLNSRKDFMSDFMQPMFFHDPYSTHASRLWAGIFPDLIHIKIDQGIQSLMSISRSYVRKSMSRECFECLTILYDLIKAGNTTDDIYASYIGNLLFTGSHCPTNEMVNAVLHQFGYLVDPEMAVKHVKRAVKSSKKSIQKSALKNAEPIVANDSLISSISSNSRSIKDIKRSASRKIDSVNLEFLNELRKSQGVLKRTPNFVEMYKLKYPIVSNPKIRSKHSGTSFNYSIQEISSTSHQLEQLRAKMAKNPSTFYTFGEAFFSQTVSPVDVDEVMKQEELSDKQKWRTERGFLVN